MINQLLSVHCSLVWCGGTTPNRQSLPTGEPKISHQPPCFPYGGTLEMQECKSAAIVRHALYGNGRGTRVLIFLPSKRSLSVSLSSSKGQAGRGFR